MKRRFSRLKLNLFLAACMLPAGAVFAAVNTWTGTAAGEWSDGTRWSLGHVPDDNEQVVLGSGAIVTLSASTAELASFTMNSTAKLTLVNWDTALRAAEVTLNSGGNATIYAQGPFLNGAMSNRVQVVCTNLTLNYGTYIDVSGRGYDGGGAAVAHDGYGPGAGVASGEAYHSTGASHGGAGCGNLRLGTINHGLAKPLSYGVAEAPVAPGSGGGTAISSAWYGGKGGGAVRIIADGTVTLNGGINAYGSNGISHGGGGSGGSVWITCGTLAGSGTGSIMAYGGSSEAGGGGGRIAIQYDAAAQPPTLGVTLDVRPGSTSYGMGPADLGTIWLPDARFLSTTISRLRGQLVIPGFTNWAPASLTLDNCWVRFPADGFALDVAGDMIVQGDYGRYDVGGSTYEAGGVNFHCPLSVTAPVLTVGGNLILRTKGKLGVFSAPTPTNSLDHYGAWVKVAGDMSLDTGSWVYPYSHTTNGGSPRFTMRNLTVSTNAGFNADNKGFGVKTSYSAKGLGPGAGTGDGFTHARFTGATYGGSGGDTNSPRSTYGSATCPLDPGSSGGMYKAYPVPGAGGGAIRIEAVNRVTLDGTLTANGFRSYSYQSLTAATHGSGGGGSGGGIFVVCRNFGGIGQLTARGGDAWRGGGCGGGGRIAVWRTVDTFTGSMDAAGGSRDATSGYDVYIDAAYAGAAGTLYLGFIAPAGLLFTLH